MPATALPPNAQTGGGPTSPPATNAPGATTGAKSGGASGSPPSATPQPPPVSIDNPPDHVAEKGMFDDLDAMLAPAPSTPAAAPKTPPAAATPKPGETAPPAKPEAIPATPPPTAQTPKALREFAKRQEEAANAASARVAELERKLADAEKRGKDTTDITERLAAAERRRDEVERQLYALNIGESPEFQKQYVKPFNEAADFAKEQVEKMEVVTQRDEETQQPTASRPATWDDFVPIYQLSRQSITKATQQAKALFPEDYQTVMNHVAELQRLQRTKDKAAADHVANAETERQARTAEATKQKEWTASAWTKVNQDIAEKNPDLFQPDPKDKQRAEIWNKSMALVDPAFTGGKELSPIQKVTLDANVRLRAAAFPVLKYDLNKANERIAELEAQIAEMQDGRPGSTQRPGGESTPEPPKKSFAEELAELEA